MPTPYEQLSPRAQAARLRVLAANALAQYDLPQPVTFALIQHLANTTYRVKDGAGGQYVLRISQAQFLPGEASARAQAIEAEMAWLAALRQDTSLGVPEPVAAQDGALVVVAEADGIPHPHACALLKWLDGRFMRKGLKPVHLRRVGVLMAGLHVHAAAWTPPANFARPTWDAASLLGAWHDEADPLDAAGEFLPPEDRALLAQAATGLGEQITALGTGPDRFALLHADLHLGNTLFRGQEARAIDFDDCGFGHFAYDLAVTCWPLRGHPAYETFRAALFDGYTSVRPLPPGHDTHLEPYIAARWLFVTAYLLRNTAGNPNLRAITGHYVNASLATARAYLENGA